MWGSKREVLSKMGKAKITYKGTKYKRYKVGQSTFDKEAIKLEGVSPKEYTCGDCGAHYREYHFLSCDTETCPICKEQLLSCGHMQLFKDEKILEEEKRKKTTLFT